MQPDRGVRVGVHARDPRRGLAHLDAELFPQLARQRGAGVLARLDLAAWKFPVAGIGLALRTLRQEELSRTEDDGGCYFRDLGIQRTRA